MTAMAGTAKYSNVTGTSTAGENSGVGTLSQNPRPLLARPAGVSNSRNSASDVDMGGWQTKLRRSGSGGAG